MRAPIGCGHDLTRRATPHHEIATEQPDGERCVGDVSGRDVGGFGDHVPVVLEGCVLHQHDDSSTIRHDTV
jgi:hypothetical protein